MHARPAPPSRIWLDVPELHLSPLTYHQDIKLAPGRTAAVRIKQVKDVKDLEQCITHRRLFKNIGHFGGCSSPVNVVIATL